MTASEEMIYMDNQATTRVDPRVLEAMLPYFSECYGNAASRSHGFGWEAEEATTKAREQVASLIGAKPKEIIWTSGATESDNLAIKGVVHFYKDKGNHIITVETEHKAVLDTCKALERRGEATVTYLKPKKNGLIDLDELRSEITDKTILIAVMHANNEIGVLQPIADIGRIARENGIIFFTDCAQSVGKVPVNVDEMCIDLLAISGHKMYGPKGIGALYVRSRNPRVRLTAEMDGGGHERGMRSGTLNVAGVVGLGKACELCAQEMDEEAERIKGLRERLREKLFAELDSIYVNGDLEHRLPGNLNVSFAYVEGESLLMGLKDIALSSGSACTSASLEPSYVLKSIGVGDDLAHTSLRFGIGRFNSQEEIDVVAERVIKEVRRLREMSPLYEMAKEGIDLDTVEWQHD